VWVFPDEGLEVPPGTGLALVTPLAVILQASDITVVFDD